LKTKIAINGFGRIGRNAFKIAFERSDTEIAAINDLTDNKTLAYLLKWDTNYGKYQHEVGFDEDGIIVDGKKIKVLNEKDPTQLPWGEMGIDVVIESTGRFVKPEDAKMHVQAGAKRVVISAPAKGAGATTIVLGVNDDDIKTSGEVLSNASCTTNCITPVAAIVQGKFGIDKAMMTTIHSFTADQSLQDGPHSDPRRARAASENIVPTTTGAAVSAGEVLPELQGIFDGLSIRVPTSVVSLADFTFLIKKDVTIEEVNAAFIEASKIPFYEGILEVTDEPLVSSDIKGNSHSAVVDLALTQVVDGNMVKVIAWYDNEWGYSNRLVEMVVDTAKSLHES